MNHDLIENGSNAVSESELDNSEDAQIIANTDDTMINDEDLDYVVQFPEKVDSNADGDNVMIITPVYELMQENNPPTTSPEMITEVIVTKVTENIPTVVTEVLEDTTTAEITTTTETATTQNPTSTTPIVSTFAPPLILTSNIPITPDPNLITSTKHHQLSLDSFYPQNAAWEVDPDTPGPSLFDSNNPHTTLFTALVDQTAGSQTKPESSEDDLHAKLEDLLDHNTRLLDIVKATLQVQYTLFSRIVSYILP